MPIEITVPRLGWSMEEGTFSEWLKQDGDSVAVGDPLYALESDKVTQDVESLDAGVLHIPADAPKAGEKVEVGQLLGYLLAAGENIPVVGSHAVAPLPAAPSAATVSQPVHQGKLDQPSITPRARRAARELGVDWTSLKGTGSGGRIREADIRQAAPAALSSTRRIIGGRMLESQQKTAPVTLHTTADAAALVHLRKQLKSSSYNDMLVKLAAAALQKHPVLNSRWDGENLIMLSDIHIGIAVDTEEGLLAPVIRNAATLSLREVTAHSRDLTERAHARRLSADELRGGTFTISNLGAFGIDAFTPIINYPECAILGVGRILRQPVAVGDAIGLRDMITLSLTVDHRAIDGAPAARFLQTLTALIESPLSILQ